MEIAVGIKLAARGLEWEVRDAEDLGGQQRLRLLCTEGDLQGLEWDILHPAEPVAPRHDDPRPRDIGPLAAWRRYHQAWLLDQIPGAPAPAGRLAAEAYQRVPLLRAREMARPRLLLADGVGLGKTVQAGLIAADFIVRRRSHRVLIVAPPGPLLRQWEQEMRQRFGLRFTAVSDAGSLRQARRGLELGGNPFAELALCLTSIDFAKQDRVLAELERAEWDLVIIDEAHHCVAGAGEEASQRYRLARMLAARSDGLLLLTATPHDGNDAHFSSLIGLLDPALLDHDGRLAGTAYRRHVIRRLKPHIRDRRTGLPLFRDRIVIPVRVDMGQAEPLLEFHRALTALVAPRLRRVGKKTDMADALAFVSLLKRSLSTIAACTATLRVVAARYAEPATSRARRDRALRAWRRRLACHGVLDPDGEAEMAGLEAEAMAANLSGRDTEAALVDLIHLGEAAAPLDPKLSALLTEIRLIRLQHPGANILVYTEYADSQRAAVAALAALGQPVLTISGADDEAARTLAAERCATDENIVLVSTDSLAEGLNLQQRCHHLIHLDLPYNPNRLEQRNGRIDRYGQRNDPEIRYLYLADTFEERLLLRLIGKYEKARACLSVMPDTLAMTADAASLHEPFLAGFAEAPPSLLPRPAALVHTLDLAAEDEASESYRDLLREIDRAFQGFERMAVRHGWLSGAESDEKPAEPPAGIDLPAFVASVLAPDGEAHRVPPDWCRDLDGLDGFDAATGTVRLTGDPGRLRDEQGRGLLYPGRSHPLTRLAVTATRIGRIGRVAAARNGPLGLLVTYAAEAGPDFRTVFALRLTPDGAAVEEPAFLTLADAPDGPRDAWTRWFANWADSALAGADPGKVARRLAAAFAQGQNRHHQRQAAEATVWLDRQAADLCGPAAQAGDLFDPAAATGWRCAATAEQRLAGLAADPAEPAVRRRDAAEALARFRTLTEPPPPTPVTTRMLGMLLLCP